MVIYGSWYLALEDIIELMEEMISKGQYQMVMVLLGKMDKNRFVHETISMVIVNRIKNPNCESGILTESVNAIKKLQSNIVHAHGYESHAGITQRGSTAEKDRRPAYQTGKGQRPGAGTQTGTEKPPYRIFSAAAGSFAK